MPSTVELTIEAYRQRLLLQEAEQMRQMAQQWLKVESALEARVTLLAQQAAAMKADGKTVSQSGLYQMEHYQTLLAQAKAETARYSKWASDLIANKQTIMTQQGLESAVATIRAAYMDAGQVGAYFDLLPVEAVESMIGFAGDGSPLYNLLIESYPDSIFELTQILIDNTAMGINPRQTARDMLDAMGGNLNRALTIARSEQLRVYRQASREQMIASDVVEGYIRRCALDTSTPACIACIVMDGTEYPTDEIMEVHPQDRCFMQPKIKGLEPVETISGTEWLMQQSPELQQDIMGKGAYEAWQSGQIELSQMASTSVNETWGPTVQVTPLSELVP